MPYKIVQNKNLPSAAPSGGVPLMELEGSDLRLKAVADDHLYIETMQDSKNLRLNTRNYTRPTDTATAVQIKPNVSATGAASMVALEVSPRFAASCAGVDLVAIKADPLLKAGSGNLSGGVCALQANLDFGISGDRVISGDVSAFEAFLAVPSTYTYNSYISFLRVRDVNIKGWDCFLNIDSAGVGLLTIAEGTYTTAQGYLIVRVGATAYRIPLYDGTD